MSKARNEAIALVDDPVHGALARLLRASARLDRSLVTRNGSPAPR